MPNIEITGIAEEADTRSAIVEYLFSYEVPPSIAKIDASFEGDLATHTFASKLLRVTDPDSPPINLSRRYKGTAKILRYDDGWRVAMELR